MPGLISGQHWQLTLQYNNVYTQYPDLSDPIVGSGCQEETDVNGRQFWIDVSPLATINPVLSYYCLYSKYLLTPLVLFRIIFSTQFLYPFS